MSMEEELAQLREVLAEQDSRIRKLESIFELGKAIPIKKVSLKEFVLSKGPENDVQKVLTIGYYLERHGGVSAFNVDDLRKAFRGAAETPPGNMNDTVRKNVSKGHLMETESKIGSKAWILTNTGEKVVEAGFKSA